MKSLNLSLIQARKDERDTKVNRARQIERVILDGKNPTTMVDEVKTMLGMESSELLIDKAEDLVKQQNMKLVMFRNIVNFNNEAINSGVLTEEEVKISQGIENKIAVMLVSMLGLDDVSDLYEVEKE